MTDCAFAVTSDTVSWYCACAFSVIVYLVEVTTGTEPGADTDARVWLQLIGQRGDSGQRRLCKPRPSGPPHPFQAGQTDTFLVEAVDLDVVTAVRIGHDGQGHGEYDDSNIRVNIFLLSCVQGTASPVSVLFLLYIHVNLIFSVGQSRQW